MNNNFKYMCPFCRKEHESIIRQKHKELKNGESVNLNMLKASKNMKKMIRIKFENSKEFSVPFDLEEMGDTDLKIEVDKDMKEKIMKINEKIDKEIKKMKKLEEKKKQEELMKEQLKKEEIVKKNEENKEENVEDEEEEEIIPIKKQKEKKENDENKEEKKEIKEKKELTPEEDRQKRLEEKNKLLEKYKLKPRK